MTVRKNVVLFLSKVDHSQEMSLVRVLMINSDIVGFLYADQINVLDLALTFNCVYKTM